MKRSAITRKSPLRRAPGRTRRRGVVIIVITVVVMLVSLSAYGFLTLMVTEHKAAAARGDQLQAASVAASGREYLAAFLELPRSQRAANGTSDTFSSVFAQVVVDGPTDLLDSSRDERVGRFSVITASYEQSSASSWQFGYENESNKLHLGQLVLWDRTYRGSAHAALMNLPGMDESTADAVLDWVDTDHVARANGAERDYYRGLSPPLMPRDGVPPTLEELLLVRGVTREKLFGTDLNQNYRQDEFESNLVEQQAGPTVDGTAAPWAHYLTVHSAERDESFEGMPRIELNQSDLAKLHRELVEVFDPSWANFIVAYRQYGRGKGGGRRVDPAEYSPEFSRSGKYRLRSPLELIGTRVRLPDPEDGKRSNATSRSAAADPATPKSSKRRAKSSSAERTTRSKPPKGTKKPKKSRTKGSSRSSRAKPQYLYSPLTSEPGQMREYLAKFLDQVTIGSGSPLLGRVNINTAPREVLLGVPRIDLALAERILAARTMGSPDDDSHQSPAWILAEGLVTRSEMIRLLPMITTGGDVAKAQILGYYDLRSPAARFETMVDATVYPARQVYYKDLRRLGRGPLGELLNTENRP